MASQGQRHEKMQNKLLSDDIVPVKGITTCTTLDVRGMESTPKTSSKRRALWKRTINASNQIFAPKENIEISVSSEVICLETEKELTSPLVEQNPRHKIFKGTHMSRRIKTPLTYYKVYQSPLTRSKAKSLSICPPGLLKRSGSGRLLVPRLDRGSQDILYGPDGIIGISNLELNFSQGSNSEPSFKRKKLKLLTL